MTLSEVRQAAFEQFVLLKGIAPSEWSVYLSGVERRMRRATAKNDLGSMKAIHSEVGLRFKAVSGNKVMDAILKAVEIILGIAGVKQGEERGDAQS